MQAVLIGMLKSVGSMIVKMGASLLTEKLVKYVVLNLIDYYIKKYELAAAKTADNVDDIRAKKLRGLFEAVEKQWQEK